MQMAPYNQAVLDKVKLSMHAMEPIAITGMYDSGIDFLFSRSITNKPKIMETKIFEFDWSISGLEESVKEMVEKTLESGKLIIVGYLGQGDAQHLDILEWLTTLNNRYRHRFSYVLWVGAKLITSQNQEKVLTRHLSILLPRDAINSRVIIGNYEERFGFKFTTKQIKQIIEWSCGVPGLIKAMSLQVIDNPGWKSPDWESEGLASRMRELGKEYRDIQEPWHTKMGYNKLDKINQNLLVLAAPSKLGEADLKLSPQEKTIWNLLTKRHDTIINREEISRALWGDEWESKYSDWAIDQLMSQLRGKLPLVDYQARIITKKGLGYVYQKSRDSK